MVLVSIFLRLLATTSVAWGAKFSTSDLTRTTTFGNTVPNRFIVEVDIAQNIPGKREFQNRKPHDVLYEHLAKRNLGFKVEKEFNSAGLFLGSVLTLDNAQDAAAVLNIPGVKAIRPVVLASPPKPVQSHVVTSLDDSQIPADTESTHAMTGVDKLHAQGITGKGIKIAIIDTGIDYTNPYLGGAFGPGNKIIGGYDLVGDAYSTNTPVPDSDPIDQCNGHGTHVAGIVGADPVNPYNISGVAFNASINAYRIFGCVIDGQVTDDVIVDALLRAVQDGNDVLTMSLGGSDGWTEGTASVVASRIAASGKIVTIAAGNDGAIGSWYTSDPSNGIDAISVASVENTLITLQNLTVHGVTHDPITYFSTLPLPVNGTLPIYATSTNVTVTDDACNPLPDDTPDLSGFVVLVRRGTCSFTQKLTNVAAKGGNVTLIYDDTNKFNAITVGDFTAVLIQAADGVYLAEQFAAGASVSVSFPQSGASTIYPSPTGGLISTFSSYGPTNDFYFKPAIAAPGGNILSTFPVPLGTFAVHSGTSMATPFMAGVSALLFEARGTSPDVGRIARTLFETTAQRVPSSKTDGDPLQTLIQQGAGLVDAFKAIHADVLISPSELITNDTANYRGLQTFTVTNQGNDTKTFNITHVPAGTALTFQEGIVADGPVPLSSTTADVQFSPASFSVPPGQSQKVTVQITPPSGLNATDFPVFSGFLDISNEQGSYQVTYMGLGAALKDAQVVDNTDTFFGKKIPAIADADGNFITGPQNFTFNGTDFPSLVMRLSFGTPKLRLDLVDPNLELSTTLSRREAVETNVFERATFTFPFSPKSGSFASVKTLGSLFEANWQPRNSDVDDGLGFKEVSFAPRTFANGTTIPDGSYRILLRALKVTGDATNEDDFESWLSPVIGVQA